MGREIASRTTLHTAVILKSRDTQEFRILTLFSAEDGIVDAFLYGGSKSKLKSLASPFHAGTAWLYREPTRETGKISDFEIRDSFPTLRESLVKTYTASLWAEVAIKTQGGGGAFAEAERLLEEALVSLDRLPEIDAPYPSILYLWRVLKSLGLRPDPLFCSSCGSPFKQDEFVILSEDMAGFVCRACRNDFGDGQYCAEPGPKMPFMPACPELSPGARRFLTVSESKDFHPAMNMKIDRNGLQALKETVYSIVSHVCEGGLKTLATSGGVL